MPIFSWNAANIEHIAEHGVSPEEAEQVVRAASPPWPRAEADEKFLVWGQTEDGRYLQVIYVLPADEEVDPESLSLEDLIEFDAGEKVLYVIHAMGLTERMKRQYKKQRAR